MATNSYQQSATNITYGGEGSWQWQQEQKRIKDNNIQVLDAPIVKNLGQPPTTPTGSTPVAKPVSVISTPKAQADYNKKNADLFKIAQEMQLRLNTLKEAVDKKAKEEADAKLAAQNTPKDTTASDLATLGITPEKTPEQVAVENQQKVLEANQKELDAANAKMDAWVVANNSDTEAIIQNIRESYEARKRTVEDIYMRGAKSQTELGIKLGTMRYGGNDYDKETLGGILTQIENNKQNKISELDTEMNGLILQAKQASKANQFKALAENMNKLQAKQDEATKELQSLQKEALKKNQEMEAEAQTIKRQSAIAGALNDGYSVADLMATGQFTIDEIDEVNSKLQEKKSYDNLKSVQGGLYDVENNQWIIEPQKKDTLQEVQGGLFDTSTNTWVVEPKADTSKINKVAEVKQFIQSKIKGVPYADAGKLNWRDYMDAATKWIELGGSSESFRTAFNPAIYLDEDNLNTLKEKLSQGNLSTNNSSSMEDDINNLFNGS